MQEKIFVSAKLPYDKQIEKTLDLVRNLKLRLHCCSFNKSSNIFCKGGLLWFSRCTGTPWLSLECVWPSSSWLKSLAKEYCLLLGPSRANISGK